MGLTLYCFLYVPTVPTKEGAAPAAQSSSPNTPPNPTTVAVPTAPKRMTITEQLKFSPNRWRVNGKELEPGVGGIWPGKPDAKTYSVRERSYWFGSVLSQSVLITVLYIHPERFVCEDA